MMQGPGFSICVLCGARPGLNPAHLEAGRQTGQMIAANGWRAWLWRHHVNWKVVLKFGAGAVTSLVVFSFFDFVPDKALVLMAVGAETASASRLFHIARSAAALLVQVAQRRTRACAGGGGGRHHGRPALAGDRGHAVCHPCRFQPQAEHRPRGAGG